MDILEGTCAFTRVNKSCLIIWLEADPTLFEGWKHLVEGDIILGRARSLIDHEIIIWIYLSNRIVIIKELEFKCKEIKHLEEIVPSLDSDTPLRQSERIRLSYLGVRLEILAVTIINI